MLDAIDETGGVQGRFDEERCMLITRVGWANKAGGTLGRAGNECPNASSIHINVGSRARP